MAYKWMVLTLTTIGSLMISLNGSVVNVALPVVFRDLQIGFFAVEWVNLAYLLTVTALLLTFGRLGDMRGRKGFYSLGFIIFTLGSALCGASQNGEELIAFRVLQGLGAALLMVNSPAIVTDTFSGAERGKALGINVMGVYIGLMVGPVVGGFLTSAFGWRSVFYINVPIGVFTTLLVHNRLKELSSIKPGQRFDYVGSATLAVWLTLLLLALSLGGMEGWASTLMISLILGFGGMLAFFIKTEAKSIHPLLDLNLFKNQLFFAANISALLNYVALLAVLFLMPFYLITIMHYPPSLAGLLLVSMPIVMVVASPVSGWLSDRMGSRMLSTTGMGIVCASLILLATLNLNSSFYDVVGRLMLTGLGMGLFSAPNTSAVMGSAPRERLGVASATLGTMMSLGMALGVALSGGLATSLMPSHLRHAVLAGTVLNSSTFPTDAFLQGIQLTFIVSAVISAFATFTSSMRG